MFANMTRTFVGHLGNIQLFAGDVQRRATKLIPEIKNLNYLERLRKLELPTLSYRRIRGQMIEVYKIINNIYDKNVSENILTFRPNADFNLKGNAAYLKFFFIIDENDTLSEYNKIPLGHNCTNGAIYSKIYFKVEICSAH